MYTDPAGLRTYLAAQVTEQSPLGEGTLTPMPVPGGVLPANHPDPAFSIFPPDAPQFPENHTLPGEMPESGAQVEGVHDSPVPEVTWGPEDEELWRKLSFRHWPTLFSYYNITLAKRLVEPCRLPPPRPPAGVSSLFPEHPFAPSGGEAPGWNPMCCGPHCGLGCFSAGACDGARLRCQSRLGSGCLLCSPSPLGSCSG